MPITVSSINRIIAHKIIAKSRDVDAHPVFTDNLLQYASATEEQSVLIKRINKAVNNPSKAFELAFDNVEEGSLHDIMTNEGSFSSDTAFIATSKTLADMLAGAQTSLSIPSGYCIVCDGVLSNRQRFICIIKADYQEVFNIQGNTLTVISNVFLSPAREFYKIGLFVYHEDGNITPYVYDDQFSAIKIDLTKYFYADFLGLKTSDNDILHSKAFYTDASNFIGKYASVMDPLDVAGLQNALNVYYRENANQIISANDFCENHLAGTVLAIDFTDEIVTKYPRAFTLRPDLLERKMNLQRIGLSSDVTLLIRPSVHVKANITDPTQEALQPYINSGRPIRVVVLESDELGANPLEVVQD